METIEATGIDDAGRGTASWRGATLCVPDLVPGERAEVEIEHQSRQRPLAFGRIVRRLGPPSPERAAPACPAFGRCGGCVWQHLSYAAQLREKRRRVEAALAAALPAPPPVAEPIAAPATLGYRNKGKYVIGPGYLLGAYQPRSHQVVDTLGCRVVEPAIDAAARAARAALVATGLPVYDERARRGQLRYAIVRRGGDGRVLVALVVTRDTPAGPLAAAARQLVAAGAATGVVRLDNDAAGNALLSDARPQPLAGDPEVGEEVAGVALALDATAFWQINRDQAAALYALVADQAGAGPGTAAVDLYGGVGGIAFSLARRGAKVCGIERWPAAVATAERAARSAELPGALSFAVGDAAELSPGAELVVVNPPRKGLDAAARRAVIAAAPARVAYVSCGPASLARDLAELGAAGYRIRSVQPVDLMPGTPQIETLAILDRPPR